MADFNLNLEQVRIREYINGVIGEYVRFMDKNNINWTDESNEYVAAQTELYRLRDSIYKMKTEEDIRNGNVRVDELRAKIKNAVQNETELILNVGELEIYINETEKKFVEYLRSNNIKWTDTSNEYVIALEELYDIKNDTYKIRNIETANKVRARVDEIREMVDSYNKIFDYRKDIEIEIMTEDAASITAAISRYVRENNIQDDENDPLNILETMIFKLKHSLICNDYTMDELKNIKAKFEFAREYIDEVIKQNE